MADYWHQIRFSTRSVLTTATEVIMKSSNGRFSHSGFGFPGIHILTTVTAIGFNGGCGGGGGGGGGGTDSGTDSTTGGPAPQVEPGVVVRCGKDAMEQHRLVCMAKDDFDCINYSPPYDVVGGRPYIKQALCAQAWGGVPGDYAGMSHPLGDGIAHEPVIVSGNGTVDCFFWNELGAHRSPNSSPEDKPETAIDESTAIIKNLYDDPVQGHWCDDCHICWRQLEGWWRALYPDDKWNDYPWCPGKGDNIVDQAAYLAMEANNCIAESTTGDNPTTGGDSTTEEPPEYGTYVCNGASTIGGTMYDTFPGADSPVKHCMGPDNLPPPCVIATEMSAQSECEDYCDTVNMIHANEAAKDTTYKTWSPLDCAQVYNFTAPETLDPKNDCFGGAPMPSFFNPLPLLAAGEITIGNGSASSDDLTGLLAVELDGSCPLTSASCRISITELVSLNATIQGLYNTRDAAGAIVSSVPFTLTNLHVRLAQPAHGEFSPRSGVVSFPTDALYLSITTGEVTLDGVTVNAGGDAGLFMVDGVRGVWNGQQLTLDITWANAPVSIWLHATAG
ncbi:hypothetical protein [Nannocystis pusilla]|uniref:hypothetical protein n=1 Tax=Nannocystis pusilla TaxID=889268 RepID=UPI003DA51D65